jgi:hypothetical protein
MSQRKCLYIKNEKNRYFVKQNGEYKKVDLSTQKGAEQLAKRFKQSGQLAAYAWASETSNDRAGIPVNEEVADAAVKGGTRAARDDPWMQFFLGVTTGGTSGGLLRAATNVGKGLKTLVGTNYVRRSRFISKVLEPHEYVALRINEINSAINWINKTKGHVIQKLIGPARSHPVIK